MRQTPVGVGPNYLADDQCGVGQPAGVCEVGAVLLDQPQCGHGAEAAGQADASQDRPIEQRLGPLSRWPLHSSGLLRLALERDGGEHVDEDLEPENLDGQQWLVEAREGGDQDETEHRHVRRNQEDKPFWTLATRRRPCLRPSIRVTNESSPRTRSEASRATAVPLPMATATSA